MHIVWFIIVFFFFYMRTVFTPDIQETAHSAHSAFGVWMIWHKTLIMTKHLILYIFNQIIPTKTKMKNLNSDTKSKPNVTKQKQALNVGKTYWPSYLNNQLCHHFSRLLTFTIFDSYLLDHYTHSEIFCSIFIAWIFSTHTKFEGILFSNFSSSFLRSLRQELGARLTNTFI